MIAADITRGDLIVVLIILAIIALVIYIVRQVR